MKKILFVLSLLSCLAAQAESASKLEIAKAAASMAYSCGWRAAMGEVAAFFESHPLFLPIGGLQAGTLVAISEDEKTLDGLRFYCGDGVWKKGREGIKCTSSLSAPALGGVLYLIFVGAGDRAAEGFQFFGMAANADTRTLSKASATYMGTNIIYQLIADSPDSVCGKSRTHLIDLLLADKKGF